MATYLYINNTGTIVPDTGDILTQVQNEWLSALGADLILNPATPQGVLITAQTLARDSVVRNNAALANQINPNLAGGVYLDAICALTGLERDKGTPSLIRGVTLAGVVGTTIPAGVQAQTSNGDIFELISTVVLPTGGSTTGDFQSIALGAIPANAGSLTQIVTPVLGWETVTNNTAAILGTEEQSDQALRALRNNTLALQGVSLPEAIISAIYNVDGVKSLAFRENVASTTEVIDTITMLPHSIYVCVDGGTDEDVATAILNNKSLGAGYNGSTIVAVIEPISGQTYDVAFDRPTEVPFLVKTTVKAPSSLTNPTDEVINSILAYVNGEIEGEAGLTVGQDVSPFELAGAINAQNPSIYVQKVEVRTSLGSFSTNPIDIEINEIGVTQASSITVIFV